jgi:hypothetical protein
MINKEIEIVIENVIGSHDVQEILMINRSRLNALVGDGKLKPIKELKSQLLFWKPDVDLLRDEMIKNSRTNLFKMKGEMKHA